MFPNTNTEWRQYQKDMWNFLPKTYIFFVVVNFLSFFLRLQKLLMYLNLVTGCFANGRFASVSGQFANVLKSVRKLVEVSSHMSTCVLTIRFAIFGFEIKRYNHFYVNPDVNLGFNYTIQNSTLHIVCVNYWIWNIENILFLAKVYFIIKWKVDDATHWLQVDWLDANRLPFGSFFIYVCEPTSTRLRTD